MQYLLRKILCQLIPEKYSARTCNFFYAIPAHPLPNSLSTNTRKIFGKDLQFLYVILAHPFLQILYQQISEKTSARTCSFFMQYLLRKILYQLIPEKSLAKTCSFFYARAVPFPSKFIVNKYQKNLRQKLVISVFNTCSKKFFVNKYQQNLPEEVLFYLSNSCLIKWLGLLVLRFVWMFIPKWQFMKILQNCRLLLNTPILERSQFYYP